MDVLKEGYLICAILQREMGRYMMFEKEAMNFILQDMPEGIIVAMFCFTFLNVRLRWNRILIIAVITSFVNMIEVVPLAFGIRTLVLLGAYMVLVKAFTGKDMSKTFFAAFLAMIIEAFGDVAWGLSILQPATGLSYNHVYNTPYLRALFSYPSLLTVLVATYLVYIYKKRRMVDFQ